MVAALLVVAGVALSLLSDDDDLKTKQSYDKVKIPKLESYSGYVVL